VEELQLTLTPSRVDQRNFGIMLANWRVGQVLNALVVNTQPNGSILLSVGGKQFVATTDIPVQPGTQLKLEVKQMGQDFVLRQVDAQPAAQPDASARLTPATTQGSASTSMASLLSQLSAVAGRLGSAELSGVARDLLGRALKGEQISPDGLKRALQTSGVFTEARLAAGQGGAAATSAKASLSTLQQMALALAEGMDPESPEFARLLALSERAGAALNGIVNQQLASVPPDDGPPRWVVSIPVELKGQYHDVRMVVERDTTSEDDAEGQGAWRVTVHVDLPNLGGVDVTVTLRGERVNVGFRCDRPQTSQWLGRSVNQLAQRLDRQELVIDRIETEVVSDDDTGLGDTRRGEGIEVKV
jgi:hypothetical protein